MDPTTVLIIAVLTLVGLAAALLYSAARRRDTDQAIERLGRATVARDRVTRRAPATTGQEAEGPHCVTSRGD